MWIFGYGSLMWDDWEKQFNGRRVDGTSLKGFHRSFNKKSTTSRGTKQFPCPTLGLEPKADCECIGTAFEIPDQFAATARAYLEDREGKSLPLTKLEIVLPDKTTIKAYVPLNNSDSPTYMGRIPIEERTLMAKRASGKRGACEDYARNILKKLNTLGINDEHVKEFVGKIPK